MSYRRDQPAHRPAAEQMLADDRYRDLPLGGYAGEVIAPTSEAPAPPAQLDPGFVIEPPPWAGREAELELPASAPSPPALDALSAMKAASGDGWDPPPLPGPPIVNPPLPPMQIPAPDWKAEQAERAQRELEPEQPSYPATKARRKP